MYKVIRGEVGKHYGEASFKAEEKSGDRGCRICGRNGHFWKGCDFYNDNFTLEQNKKYFKKHHDKVLRFTEVIKIYTVVR